MRRIALRWVRYYPTAINCRPLTRCVPALLRKACLDEYEKELANLSSKEETNRWTQQLELDLAGLPDIAVQTDSAWRVVDIHEEFIRLVSLLVLHRLLNYLFTCPIDFPCSAGPCAYALFFMLYQPLQPGGASDVRSGCRIRGNVLNPH